MVDDNSNKTITTTAPPGLSSLPPWIQAVAFIGFPGFVALYLLGAIPGLPSSLAQEVSTMRAELGIHGKAGNKQADHLTNVLSAICLRLPDNPRAPRCPNPLTEE